MPSVWVAPSFDSQDMRSFEILCLHRASGEVLLDLGVELAFEPRP